MNPNFSAEQSPIVLYRHPLSGHAHRAQLMLSLLDVPYETVDVDLMGGEHKTPDFLAKNPFGQVPVIEDNGVHISDANAILVYLATRYADGYEWLPTAPQQAAEVQRWLSVAAGEIFNGPCMVRLVKLFGMPFDYDTAKQRTDAFFAILEPLLAASDFLVDGRITLADVAAYSYIAHVEEGAVSLAPYPAIRAWLARVEAQPRFVGMQRSELAA